MEKLKAARRDTWKGRRQEIEKATPIEKIAQWVKDPVKTKEGPRDWKRE